MHAVKMQLQDRMDALSNYSWEFFFQIAHYLWCLIRDIRAS